MRCVPPCLDNAFVPGNRNLQNAARMRWDNSCGETKRRWTRTTIAGNRRTTTSLPYSSSTWCVTAHPLHLLPGISDLQLKTSYAKPQCPARTRSSEFDAAQTGMSHPLGQCKSLWQCVGVPEFLGLTSHQIGTVLSTQARTDDSNSATTDEETARHVKQHWPRVQNLTPNGGGRQRTHTNGSSHARRRTAHSKPKEKRRGLQTGAKLNARMGLIKMEVRGSPDMRSWTWSVHSHHFFICVSV